MSQIIYIQATDDSTGAPLGGVSLSFEPFEGSPPMVGGITGTDGKFQKEFWFFWPEGVNYFRYTLRGEKAGYGPRLATVDAVKGGISQPLLNMQVANLENVTSSGIPALVSAINPPALELSGLPYYDYAYVETVVESAGDRSPIETAVKPDGTCVISLVDRFRIEPFPSLVTDNNTPLADAYLRKDYKVTATLVTGTSRRYIGAYATTALLIDHPKPEQLYFKWLCGDSFAMGRGTYCDVMILLPLGSYSVSRRQGGNFPMTPLLLASDGTTPMRIRIPNVPTNYSTLTMQVVQDNAPVSTLLTINFRD